MAETSPAAILGSEDVSPELALVDPVLAALARERLRDPGDTIALAGSHRHDRESSRESAPDGDVVSAQDPRSDEGAAFQRLAAGSLATPVQYGDDDRGRLRLRLVALAAAVPALVAVVTLAASSWIQTSRGPTGPESMDTQRAVMAAAADPGATIQPRQADPAAPVESPPVASAARPSGARPSSSSRRLAWAPADGATRYHVELFRGSSLVFSADTAKAAIVVPSSWRAGRRVQSLRPGEYQWYVWPVVSGRRGTQAIVQAKLEIRP